MSFNLKHPELGPKEVFLINLTFSSVLELLIATARGKKELELAGRIFKYFRLGNFSYDERGTFLRGVRPVFVSANECGEK